jgi:hypothetical protein
MEGSTRVRRARRSLRIALPLLVGACAAIVAFGSAACGTAAEPAAVRPPAAPVAEAAAPALDPALLPVVATPLPPSNLRRSDVRRAIKLGLGFLLQKVTFEDRPVFVQGKFHGFRVAELNDAAFFRGIDLKKGDVVVRVNGFPIERDDEALGAFQSLAVASELRVDYERRGEPRALRFGIVDDEPTPRKSAQAPSNRAALTK